MQDILNNVRFLELTIITSFEYIDQLEVFLPVHLGGVSINMLYVS